MKEKLTSLMKSVEANHIRGIRNRTRIAIICALCFISINTAFVAINYKLLPDVIPGFHDANGVFVKSEYKSAFFLYELEFLALLLVMASVARVMKPMFKEQLVYARTRCLLFDIANLYIVTVVGITTILLSIAKGGETEELSYFSQAMILLFWTVVMIVEYLLDLRKIRKQLRGEL